MSGATRQLRADEVHYLWPALRGSHAFGSERELGQFREATPWAVRVSGHGDALVLERWREHMPALAIRALVAPTNRVRALIDDACAVARSQAFTQVLSPLVVHPGDEYAAAGMEPLMRIVAFTARVGAVYARQNHGAAPPAGVVLRQVGESDIEALAALDGDCFDAFWRQGPLELAADLETSRVVLAERTAGGEVVGYSSALRRGRAVTIGRLAVAPSARRQGVARALLADIDGWARQQEQFGLSLCTQEDNSAARNLYGSAGFEEAPGRYLMLSRAV